MVRGSEMNPKQIQAMNDMQLGQMFGNKQIPIKPMPTIEPLHNLIDHPPHYTAGKVEVIDYIVDKLTAEQFEGYCIGNVLKYVSRYRHKGGFDDLKKAVWYLNRVIESQ